MNSHGSPAGGRMKDRRLRAAKSPPPSVGKAFRESGGYGAGRGRFTARGFAAEQALERVVSRARDVSLGASGEPFDEGQVFAFYCCADWLRREMEFASKITATLWKGQRLRHFDPDSMLRWWTAAKRPRAK
ncbi:MAG: hypothetical protein QM750_23080 [Rubrivivax sp.]